MGWLQPLDPTPSEAGEMVADRHRIMRFRCQYSPCCNYCCGVNFCVNSGVNFGVNLNEVNALSGVMYAGSCLQEIAHRHDLAAIRIHLHQVRHHQNP